MLGNADPTDQSFALICQNCIVPCVFDVNQSGNIDVIDVQHVAGAFDTNVPAYDFNDSGFVDVGDIQLVAEHWSRGC